MVVSGGAQGADTVAEEAACQRGLTVLVLPADWDGLGRKVGPIRNQQIVDAADQLVTFWDGEGRDALNILMLGTGLILPASPDHR